MKKFNFTLSLLILYSSIILGQEKYQRLPNVDISQIWHSASIPEHNMQHDPQIDNIINQTNLDSLISFVRILSGEDSVWIAGTRVRIQHRISNDNDLAADYIKQKLESYNLDVYDQIFRADGRNVYAIQPGYLYPEKQYIICAHYDAVDDYGADDNASGVAAVLEAARILSPYDFNYTLVYALWDEEEIGFFGSQYYAAQASLNQSDIIGVLNIDMIGWDSNADGLSDIHSSNIANSDSLANLLMITNSLYNLPLSPVIYNPGTGQSDHSSFWNYGYGAVLLMEAYYGGDLNPYYHSNADRIDKFDLNYFYNLSKLSIGTISTLIDQTIDTLITRIIPNQVRQNTKPEIMIYGQQTNFADSLGTLDVWLSRASETIFADSFAVHSNTSLTAYFTISLTATLDLWDVNVETAIDGILTKEDGFEIFPEQPPIINVPADIDSIQGGIDLAISGDTVLVQPGIYVENINFNGKNIVVGSLNLTTGDTSYISQTVIDGDSSGSVVTFENGENSTAVLSGFTITGGSGTYHAGSNLNRVNTFGGGIYIINSNPTIFNLLIIDNGMVSYYTSDYVEGGGIYLENSTTQISHTKILSNIAVYAGGGISCLNSNPTFTELEITNNTCYGTGGGISLSNSHPTILNSLISNNVAIYKGGGIYCEYSNPFLDSVIIVRNTSEWACVLSG